MEVFSIRYLADDILTPEKQMGTISLIHGPGRQYLYKVDDTVDTSTPSIKFGDQIMVTVKAPTCTESNLFLEYDLFSGAYQGRKLIEWEDFKDDEVSMDYERLCAEDGTGGELRVYYGLFTNATVADVEVKFLGNSSANVCGFVVARNSKMDPPTLASMLFWKEFDAEKIELKDGIIPLSKSRVGLPFDTEFYVMIILKCDDVDYTGKLTLTPQEAGTIEENICDGNFQVRVTWDSRKESIVSTYE
ncbi:hypothetical protein POM88_006280 [Heracleum sosnowskyi]|uniref:DUF6598 domain-containing protein n=1 Tax=Heracleum sosnowskyi TaxID=360622 RepID=A0AAD8J5Q3_9APIA|nr:hypothetical protein POM88_006280 [Heracleum sosnowskyi]